MRAYVQHDLDEINGLTQSLQRLTATPHSSPQIFTLQANLELRNKNYAKAIQYYDQALSLLQDPRILYGRALAYYYQNNYSMCMSNLGQLVEVAVKLYPELSDSCQQFKSNDQIQVPIAAPQSSHLPPQILLASSFIEAFNLKAAIEYNLGDEFQANTALNSMPYRNEQDLDAVTLHNRALVELSTNPQQAVKKLQYLVQNPPYPTEALSNLITLYISYELYEPAADFIAQNQQLLQSSIDQNILGWFQAVTDTVQEGSFIQLEKLKTSFAVQLRRLRSEITSLKQQQSKMGKQMQSKTRFSVLNSENLDSAEIQQQTLLQQYESKINIFIPIIMYQTGILYDLHRYNAAIANMTQYGDLLESNPAYLLNEANIAFAQEKYTDALELYKQLVMQLSQNNILDVPAIAVANLCACYILTSQNPEAEKLMQQVDTAQKEAAAAGVPQNQLIHLSIINIVIGTLYQINQNPTFGVKRILASLESNEKQVSADQWLYIKNSLMYLAYDVALGLEQGLEEELVSDIINYLSGVEKNCQGISTVSSQAGVGLEDQIQSVGQEAGEIKRIYECFI